MTIQPSDRKTLRELAKKHLSYAKSGEMQRIVSDWKEHNAFHKKRPMVYLEINAYRDEVIDPYMRCEGEFARTIEEQLRYDLVNFEQFKDDKVVTDYFPVNWDLNFSLFGLKILKKYADAPDGKKLAYHIDPVIHDLQEDFGKLGAPVFQVNRKRTMEKMDILSETFGDILPVRLSMNCLNACITQQLVFLMGMENLFFAICDYPGEFHRMMRMACDAYHAYFDWLEREGLLLPTNGEQRLGQGSYCFTEELPGAPDGLTVKQVWGFMDSQESAPISPAMFQEFLFPYYKELGERFGLLSYGCCEPVHPIWENCISAFSNLRKVSISAWCDMEYMGERLRGRNIVFHRKPPATLLTEGTALDEEAVRKSIRQAAVAARGCTLEIAQRDVCTIHRDPRRARRYIELVRETAERYWQP